MTQDSKIYKPLYLIRDFASLALLSFAWTEDEAMERAKTDHPHIRDREWFVTTILVERPPEWQPRRDWWEHV